MTTVEPGLRQVAVPGRRLALRRVDPPGGSVEPPVLLLHGVPETSRCWTGLIEELGRDRTVLAPDLPGLGSSEIRGPYDVRSVAASLIALLAAELDGIGHLDATAEPGADQPNDIQPDDTQPDDIQPDDIQPDDVEPDDVEPVGARVDVIGHDWGGTLGLAIAAARPDLIRRLGVINAPYRTVDVTRAWHIPLLGYVSPGVFSGAGRSIVRAMFRYAWKTGRPPEELVEAYATAYEAPERVRAMAGYYRAAVRRRRPVDGTSAPSARAERSLVVWGTEDPPMPMRVGEAVVSDLGLVNDPATVRMVTLPGVGHWPLEELPGVVVPLLADFVRSP